MAEGSGETDFKYNPTFEAKKDVRDWKEVGKFLEEEGSKEAGKGRTTIAKYIDDFVKLWDKGTFVIQDLKTGRQYSYGAQSEKEPGFAEEMENLTDTTFILRDSVRFMDKVAQFEEVLGEQTGTAREGRNRWVVGQGGTRIWANATPFDFQNPERFLDREIFLIQDKTFADLVDWKSIYDSNVLKERLFVKRTTPSPNFESPNDLRFAFGSSETPGNLDDLPVVRYGLVAPDTAVIYAVQMPSTGEATERVLKKRLALAEEKAVNCMEFFKRQYKENGRALKATMGEFPKEIWSIDDPEQFTLAFYGQLMDKLHKEGYADLYTWSYDHSYRDKPTIFDKLFKRERRMNDLSFLRYKIEPLEEAALVLQQRKDIEEQLRGYDQRRERIRRVNDPMKGNVPSDLREAPPSAVMSLAIALKMFEAEGITKIEMPLYLPFRRHQKEDPKLLLPTKELDDELDRRIFEQSVKIMQRVSREINGFEITADPDTDGYLHAEIKGKLSSERPIFKEIFQALEENPIHGK